MSIEVTDTTNKYANQEIPDGTRTFTVLEVTKKYGQKGGEYFVWKLSYEGGIGEQILLPNMMRDLLKTLNCEEIEPGKYKWDTTEQVDKTFSATVLHKADVKDATKIRQHMSGFLPF